MHEIRVLPSVVALSVLGSAVLLGRLHRRAALTLPRAVVAAVLSVYGAGVVGNTLLPVHLGWGGGGVPWWQLPNVTPLAGTEPADALANVLLFAPLGVLVPLVARVRSARGVLLCGFTTSLTMELLQWVNAVVAHGGHVPDVNDLLANTLGAALGHGAFRLTLLVPAARRLARSATWPAPDEEAGPVPAQGLSERAGS